MVDPKPGPGSSELGGKQENAYFGEQQPTSVNWAELAQHFAAFERQVLSHEHAEIHLWGEAYARDVGTKD